MVFKPSVWNMSHIGCDDSRGRGPQSWLEPWWWCRVKPESKHAQQPTRGSWDRQLDTLTKPMVQKWARFTMSQTRGQAVQSRVLLATVNRRLPRQAEKPRLSWKWQRVVQEWNWGTFLSSLNSLPTVIWDLPAHPWSCILALLFSRAL